MGKIISTDGQGTPLDTNNKFVGCANIYDNSNSGSTKTINWNNGNMQKVTMTDNCTFSFIAPTGLSGICHLIMIQDADGTNTHAFTGGGLSIVWNGGTEPTWTTTGNKINIASFIWDGTTWRGGSGWVQG